MLIGKECEKTNRSMTKNDVKVIMIVRKVEKVKSVVSDKRIRNENNETSELLFIENLYVHVHTQSQ